MRSNSCCHCGRAIWSKSSLKQGCGYYCLHKHGYCDMSQPPADEGRSSKVRSDPPKYGKSFARSVIIGAAIAAVCLVTHGFCLIAKFIQNHELWVRAAAVVVQALRSSKEERKTIRQSLSVSASEVASSVTASRQEKAAGAMGSWIAKALGNTARGLSKSWLYALGKGTSKAAMGGGMNAAFDWGSKAVVG